MIEQITFKNYKIFKDKQSLDLKPLTVIFGKNNSGKSAVAKLPTLIEGGLVSDSSEALNFENGDVVLGAELRDLVYGKANRVIEFELKTKLEYLSFGVLISNDNNKQTALMDYWITKNIDLHYTDQDKIYHDSISQSDYVCEFQGLNLKNCAKKDLAEMLTLSYPTIKLRTDFIGPIRIQPQRDFRLPAHPLSGKSGVCGENSYYYLINDALTTEKKLVKKVSDWYKENFDGWEVKINQDKSPIFEIEIQKDDLKQNILDTGIGMSQVLPIVTRAMMPCEEETLIIIEEPETHLHPAAHGNLASLLVESLEDGNKRYLVETHSLNFILRLRRLVAEKKLSKNDFSLYHVHFSESTNSSSLKRIDVNELGGVKDWPDGIFNETLNETVAIRTAQIDNSAYGDRDKA